VSYTLGVDLGTTFTAAATVDDGGVPTMVGLGNRALQIPSVLYFGADGTVLVGEMAERHAVADPTRVVREFKRRMGDRVPILVAGAAYSPQMLTGRLLRWVVEQTAERLGDLPSRVVLTHPASWQQFKVDTLHQAAALADLPAILTRPEPVAAALQYADTNRVEVGQRICVYDLGGGTFDVCVVRRTLDGFEILGVPEGIEHLGGIDFDEAVFDQVRRDLSPRLSPVDHDDPGFWRLRRDCVDGKEALSVDVDTDIPVSLAGVTTSVRLTRAEFEGMIRPALGETIDATHRALNSAGLAASDLTGFVLVGGSSRIPLVSEMLSAEFRCSIARNTHPKHDIALGAALAGVVGTGTATTTPLRIQAPAAAVPRGTRRRTVRRTTGAGVATVAIVGAVVAGWAWLGASASADSPLGTSPEQAGTAASVSNLAVSNLSVSNLSVSTAVSSTAAASDSTSALTSTDPTTMPSLTTTSAVSSGSDRTTSLPPPAVRAPSSLDRQTVIWLQTLCDGGKQMNKADIVAGTNYPDLDSAQAAYVQSYALQSAGAEQTASRLQALAAGSVADGRIDVARTVAELHKLQAILSDSSQQFRDLTPRGVADLDAAARRVSKRVRQDVELLDMKLLSAPETEFVTALPGCQLS